MKGLLGTIFRTAPLPAYRRRNLSIAADGSVVLEIARHGEARRQKALVDAQQQEVKERAAFYDLAREDSRVGPHPEEMIPRPPERRASAPEHESAPWYASG